MPTLSNIENNISLELNLLDNNYLDISSSSDFERWIPFDFKLIVEKEKYLFSPQTGACFSLYELKMMIQVFERIANQKRQGLKIERSEFHSCEAYFDIIVYDPLDENRISVEIWINMGALTNGISYGYKKGFDFVVLVDTFTSFIENLKKQLYNFERIFIN